MFFYPVSCPGIFRSILALVITVSAVISLPTPTKAQTYERELNVGAKPALTAVSAHQVCLIYGYYVPAVTEAPVKDSPWLLSAWTNLPPSKPLTLNAS